MSVSECVIAQTAIKNAHERKQSCQYLLNWLKIKEEDKADQLDCLQPFLATSVSLANFISISLIHS